MKHWCALTRDGHPVDREGRRLPSHTDAPLLTAYAAFTLRRLSFTPKGPVIDLDEGALLAGTAAAELLSRPHDPAALFAAADAAVLRAAAAVTDDFRAGLLQRLHTAGCRWAEPILRAAGRVPDATLSSDPARVTEHLPERVEALSRGIDEEEPIDDAVVIARLNAALAGSGAHRPGQIEYAKLVNRAMQPGPSVAVLAEAETGTGKTLGYLAAAAARAANGERAVWIATYTKALQTQAKREARRFYPDPDDFRRKVAIRKGRENYLCLLKYADPAAALDLLPGAAQIVPTLLAWLMLLPDADGDVSEVAGRMQALYPGRPIGEFTDKRGECIHSACTFYKKCFIERAGAAARRAELVIANHALVLHDSGTQVGRGRIIFDEAHRLFDAADQAYAIVLGVEELAELRRRLHGADRRTLIHRIDELLKDITDGGAVRAAAALLSEAARTLPGEGCLARLRSGLPQGPLERFFTLLYAAAQAENPGEGAGFECAVPRRDPGLQAAALEAGEVLRRLASAGEALAAALEAAADDETPARAERLNSFLRLHDQLLRQVLPAYVHMLTRLTDVSLPEPTPPAVDFVEVNAFDGRLSDVRIRRHLLNPAAAFGERILKRAEGAVLTSAGLRDDSHAETADRGAWTAAEFRTGVHVLTSPALRAAFPSPFDYGARVQLLILSGARRMIRADADYGHLMGELFTAAGGGGLGIFTSIRRLRGAYPAAAARLRAQGIDLYAQHVDAGDVSIPADMFRHDPDSCLLGTDAVRDGLDVPGRALRLVVCDRVPYPRPTFLHLARRAAFGGRAYDRMIIRGKLKQAFGRLMRRESDRGAFVILDDRCDDGLWSWLPHGVQVQRLGFEEMVQSVRLACAETAPAPLCGAHS